MQLQEQEQLTIGDLQVMEQRLGFHASVAILSVHYTEVSQPKTPIQPTLYSSIVTADPSQEQLLSNKHCWHRVL